MTEILPIISTVVGVLLTFLLGMVVSKLNGIQTQVIASKVELSAQIAKLDDRLLTHVTASELHERNTA